MKKLTEVWVVDRFNEGEVQDFHSDEIYDSMAAAEVFATLELAQRATEQIVRDEIEELKDDEPELELELEPWTPKWINTTNERTGEPSRSVVLEAPHDGSVYTARPIPLNWA